MKRIISLAMTGMLLISAFPASAEQYYSAQEVYEQAQEGWHETYTDVKGRTIPVDIDVYVPEVSTMPVSRLKMVRMEEPEVENKDDFILNIEPQYNGFVYYTKEYMLDDDPQIEWNPENIYWIPANADEIYAPGNEEPLAAMLDIIRSSMEHFHVGADGYDFTRPYDVRLSGIYEKKSGQIARPGQYSFNVYQTVHGIPILCHSGYAFIKGVGTGQHYEAGCVARSENEYLVTLNKVTEAERKAEDIPLCSFDQIVKSIEQEIIEGHIRKVYSLELGYIVYNDPEEVFDCDRQMGYHEYEHMYAVPGWRLQCLYVADKNEELPNYGEDEFIGKEQNSLEFMSVVVNAQTGEVQDPRSTDSKRSIYRGVISWEDVK